MDAPELISEIRRASRALARELGVIGAGHPTVPCTVTEGHLLVDLDLEPGLRLNELADRLALDKSTTSRALSGLVTRGLVSESVDPRDLRRKFFHLTGAGRKVAAKIHVQADERVREALNWLDPDEAGRILDATRRYAGVLNRARRAREYEIRKIRRDDNLQVAELLRDVRVEHRHIIGDEAEMLENEERDMHRLYRGRDRCYLVVAKKDKVLGGGGFSPLKYGDSEVCELQRMYFRPDIRGMGLGLRLLRQCISAARDAGFHACYAETMAGMEAANGLYEKVGFRRLKAPLGATGHTFTDAWFRLDL